MQWVEHEGRRGLIFDHLPDDFPVAHVFTAKQADGSGNVSLSGGRSAAAALAERRSWSRYLDTDLGHWVVGCQTHEAKVAVVDPSHRGCGAFAPSTVLPHTDGMLTITPGLALYVAGADCATVLLACAAPRPAFAVIHAGWRGAAAGIVGNGLAKLMQQSGAPAEQVYAGVAPCIGAASFEVGDEVAEQVPLAWRHRPTLNSEAPTKSTATLGKWHVDLAGWIGAQIESVGVPSAQIQLSGKDTMAENDLFFSHRGDGSQTGRQGLIAVLRD